MASHKIEEAKTGRSTCRTCKQTIAKGDLRFGEEVANAFGEAGATTFVWHHLPCAAKKKPNYLKEALKTHVGDVPDREKLEAIIESSKLKDKPTQLPYAERAKTNRSHCQHCREVIEKSTLRVAIQTEGGAPGMMDAGARYLHAHCAPAALALPDLRELLRTHSTQLGPADLQDLETELESAPKATTL